MTSNRIFIPNATRKYHIPCKFYSYTSMLFMHSVKTRNSAVADKPRDAFVQCNDVADLTNVIKIRLKKN